ncbi:MAG: hypothetical protein KAW12_12980 [Candidatus Aminicenantes bacterium]|nr:hypothetical protein [Candidatus Aminicenantes bacterium]
MKKKDKNQEGIFCLKVKSNINWVGAVCLILSILISTIIVQVGIWDYESSLDRKTKFLETERNYFDRYVNYLQYGVFGFRMFVESSKLCIFFNNASTFDELEATIDCSLRLKIGNPKKDGKIFAKESGGSFDLKIYVLLLLVPLAFIYGFFTYRNRENLKFLMNFSRPLKVYTMVFLSRAFVLFISLFVVFTAAVIQIYCNGIYLSRSDFIYLLASFLVTTGILILPLIVGAVIGTLRNLAFGLSILVLIWITTVHLWPYLFNRAINKYADVKIESKYSIENKKTKIVGNFEKSIRDITNTVTDTNDRQQEFNSLFEKYWNGDFKKANDLEKKTIGEIKDVAKKLYFWCIINPFTFYHTLTNELSSRGYHSYLEFYKESNDNHKGFFRFYIDNWVLGENKQLVPFKKLEDQVFYAKPSFPAFFVLGLFVLFSWITLFYTFGYFLFKKSFFHRKKKNSLRDVTLELESGKHHFYSVNKNELLITDLFALLSSKKTSGNLSIDGKKVVSGVDFLYLPALEKIPAVFSLSSLAKFLGVSEKVKNRYELMQEFFKKLSCDVLLLDNFFYGIDKDSSQKLLELIEKLKKKGIIVIEVVRPMIILTGQNAHGRYDEYKEFVFEKKAFKNSYTSRKSK